MEFEWAQVLSGVGAWRTADGLGHATVVLVLSIEVERLLRCSVISDNYLIRFTLLYSQLNDTISSIMLRQGIFKSSRT
jgi:hypothetical protein